MNNNPISGSFSESDDKYRIVIDQSPDGIFIIDFEGNFLSVNNSTCRVLKYSEQELLSMKIWDIIPDKYKLLFKERMLKLIEHKEINDLAEYEVYTSEGKRLHVEVLSAPYFKDDKIAGFLGIARDITERKNLEAKLIESEERLRQALEGTNDGIWDVNLKTGDVYLSPRGCEILGFGPDELNSVMNVWSDIVHPDDMELTKTNLNAYINGETPIFQVEQRLRMKSGEWKWILTRGKAVSRDENSNPLRMVGTHTDISDRKKAEDELKKKNYFIQTILDNLPIGVALNVIEQGTSFYINKKFEEIYGWSSEELTDISKFFNRVYPDENYRNELINRIMSDINSGDASRLHWENCHITQKNGTKKVVNAVNIPLYDQNTMVSTVMDITEVYNYQQELKQAKDKAEEMSRLKSSFLANMSHELRTPLIGILGFAEILSTEIGDAEHQEMVNSIYKSGKRLNETLNMILEFSKAESNKVNVTTKKINTVVIVKERVDLFSSVASLKKLKMELVLLDNPIYAMLDESLFVGILNNLINNALKFTNEGGVTIELGKESSNDENNNKWFFVKVTDTGIGISEENQSVIFTEFRQVSEGLGRRFEGTGLGLTITKRITELMGGTISVESRLGEGSTFTVRFPVLY